MWTRRHQPLKWRKNMETQDEQQKCTSNCWWKNRTFIKVIHTSTKSDPYSKTTMTSRETGNTIWQNQQPTSSLNTNEIQHLSKGQLLQPNAQTTYILNIVLKYSIYSALSLYAICYKMCKVSVNKITNLMYFCVYSFVVLLRQLWEIFKSHMSENKVLLHGKIRSVLNSIGLFPTHSQSKYIFFTIKYEFILSCCTRM